MRASEAAARQQTTTTSSSSSSSGAEDYYLKIRLCAPVPSPAHSGLASVHTDAAAVNIASYSTAATLQRGVAVALLVVLR